MLGVILLGMSNSGKSTIGKKVAEMLGMRYISSGDIARSMSEEIQGILNQGELAPENIMRERILSAINDADIDFILDGFPRFYEQYEWLNQVTSNVDFLYVYIDASYTDIMNRSIARGRCDDGSITRKFEMFYNHTRPMLEEITKTDKVYYINNGEGNSIYDSICTLCKFVEVYHANNQ